jgi:hypothetical protein
MIATVAIAPKSQKNHPVGASTGWRVCPRRVSPFTLFKDYISRSGAARPVDPARAEKISIYRGKRAQDPSPRSPAILPPSPARCSPFGLRRTCCPAMNWLNDGPRSEALFGSAAGSSRPETAKEVEQAVRSIPAPPPTPAGRADSQAGACRPTCRADSSSCFATAQPRARISMPHPTTTPIGAASMPPAMIGTAAAVEGADR